MPRLNPRPSAPRTKTDGVRLAPFAFASLALLAFAFLASGLSPFNSQAAGARVSARTLSLEERVAYQRAVDEVYWARTIWPAENGRPKPSLDEVMLLEATRAKVLDTLRKSEALTRHWNRPVTAAQLQAELTRMARETRQPEVLRELWRALGDDPFLIAEVLARPALVDRLARNSFEADQEAAAPESSQANESVATFDAWWDGASRQYVAEETAADDSFAYELAQMSNAAADDTWSPMQALPVSTGSAAVWTGAEVIIWGGTTQYGGRTNAGSRYNPATDTWTPTSTVGGPSPRSGHAAYWTGTEFLVWGGLVAVNCGGDGPCRNTYTNTGGRYNPLTDTWRPTSTNGAPTTGGGLTVWTGSKMLILGASASNVYDPSSDTWTLTPSASSPGPVGNRVVWTGTEVFTWGGINNASGTRGGLFNPETGTWRHPNNLNAPSERNGFSMVWTGTEVVVWGGYEGNFVTLNTGGRYNPQTDTWTPTSTANTPAARYGHVAVWTGSEMVIHGGDLRPLGQIGLTNTGARYNPVNDSWAATPTAKSPTKFAHVAVWTGTEVFVWGGSTGSGSLQKAGARFNPSTDTWTPVNNNDSPLYLDRGVWTGTEMLVWGENSLCNCFTSVGGRYDPATNVWRPMNLAGAPAASTKGYGTNAVWTGKEMLVWGGGRGRYNPLTDTWAAISSTNAPSEGYTAVWTGNEMIVWGSSNTQGDADTGGRYNPETDTWRPTSTVGAPSGRYMHTAVWSGSEMIVWGGTTAGVFGKHSDGGRYNPETDTWRPTSTAGAPEGRTYHTAVWAGSVMVVWGGMSDAISASESRLNTGGRYDPVADTWTPTSTAGAPAARTDHRAVWTGSQMIVWGGIVKGVTGGDGTYTGARYNPQTDVWTTMSTLSAPSKRSQHVQVWTGTQMIVWGGMAAEGAATHGAIYNAPSASPAGNLPPTVSLTAPAGGSSYQSGDAVQLAAEVSDPDGTVTSVRFYANGQVVGRDTQAPFTFIWSEVRGGDYALTAVATDDGNAEGRSAAVNISVTPSTTPPVCVLTNPADGASYAYNDAFYMEATATANRDRSIARVEFLDNDSRLTYYEPPTYNAPWRYYYQTLQPGTRSLTARCTDNLGGVTTSAPKVITVDEQGFSVSGQVLDSRGFTISGIRLRLDGPAGTAPRYVTTTVAGNGNYHFGGLKPGETYKVTPEPGAWKFTPESNTYTSISRGHTGQHFVAERVGHAITGRLTDAGGNPIYPATVNMSGSKNATTNVLSDGTYFFYNLVPGGTYTVQPYKNLYTFAPNFRTFENLSADQTADFKGAPQTTTYKVAGRVVDNNGVAVAGLRMRLDTARVTGTQYRTTDAYGRYSFDTIQAGENFNVGPEDFTYAYYFEPPARMYVELSKDVSDADFVATPRTVSGRVTQSGAGLAGVTVKLDGPQGDTVTTGDDGGYAFKGITMRGDYTVTASKPGYALSPAVHTLNDLKEDMTANFAGAPQPTPAPALTNYALASNGGVATASSTTTQQEFPGLDFSPAGVINGDRRGLGWERGGGWRDATNDAFPDWLQVDFDGAKAISEVHVFSLQDSYTSPAEPTEQTAFTQYGVTAFDLLYWDGAGWAAVPGASVVGNDRVWRKLTFPAVTTTRLRLVVRDALAGRSRLVEVEAWGAAAAGTPPAPPARLNAALASNGGVATASSTTTQAELPGMDFSPAGAINGDRRGLGWERGGGWRDATAAFPDWLQVSFAAPTAVDEISVFSLQDDYASPSEPTEATAFTQYGVTSFEAQYWDGSAWATVPGGAVTNNSSVWRRLTFPAVTTTKVRVVINNALAGRSRLVEVEAWGVQGAPQPTAARVNHAAASNGGAASASSTTTQEEFPGLDFSPAGAVDGDRRGLNWERGGGWRDATNNSYPDWLQVDFAGARKVDEVSVFSLQDAYTSPSEPTEALTFTQYGVTSFEVQYWDGSSWVTAPGGVVTGNSKVWRKVTFPEVTTTKVRVVVHNALGGRSRIVEVEASGPAS